MRTDISAKKPEENRSQEVGPRTLPRVGAVDLPVTLTPCLGEWLANKDHYETLSDMHPAGGCHVLQLINITLEGEIPTGEIMLHDGKYYVNCKVK